MSKQPLPRKVYRVQRSEYDGGLRVYERTLIAVRGSWQTTVDKAGRTHRQNGLGGWSDSVGEAVSACAAMLLLTATARPERRSYEQIRKDIDWLLAEMFSWGKLLGEVEASVQKMKQRNEISK